MKKYYYDLHLHSALSPCGDNSATPAAIVGFGKLNGLDIMALTDHNTTKNCPAFFEAAEFYGITAIAGMELTTAEEIHLVCLFESLEAATEFDAFLDDKRMTVPNRPDIFGEQIVFDAEDNEIEQLPNLLTLATSLSLDEAYEAVKGFGGICYPAHIDRNSYGIISVLGAFPPNPKFSCAELHDAAKIDTVNCPLPKEKIIISSDAHRLSDIKEAKDYFELEGDNPVKALFEFLR